MLPAMRRCEFYCNYNPVNAVGVSLTPIFVPVDKTARSRAVSGDGIILTLSKILVWTRTSSMSDENEDRFDPQTVD